MNSACTHSRKKPQCNVVTSFIFCLSSSLLALESALAMPKSRLFASKNVVTGSDLSRCNMCAVRVCVVAKAILFVVAERTVCYFGEQYRVLCASVTTPLFLFIPTSAVLTRVYLWLHHLILLYTLLFICSRISSLHYNTWFYIRVELSLILSIVSYCIRISVFIIFLTKPTMLTTLITIII